MQKGQTGIYRTENGGHPCDAVVVRVRGAGQVDIDVPVIEPSHQQMVNVGVGPGLFESHAHQFEEAPAPPVVQRLVPRYVPVWHVYALALPAAAIVSALTTLLLSHFGGK